MTVESKYTYVSVTKKVLDEVSKSSLLNHALLALERRLKEKDPVDYSIDYQTHIQAKAKMEELKETQQKILTPNRLFENLPEKTFEKALAHAKSEVEKIITQHQKQPTSSLISVVEEHIEKLTIPEEILGISREWYLSLIVTLIILFYQNAKSKQKEKRNIEKIDKLESKIDNLETLLVEMKNSSNNQLHRTPQTARVR